MSEVTISLPDEDLEFLVAYTREQRTSVDESFAEQAKNLRSRLSRPIPPDIIAVSGCIPVAVSAKQEHLGYLESKYR